MDKKVLALIAQALKLNPDQASHLAATDSVYTLSKWDSLGHLQVIIQLETEFGLKIPPADIIQLISVKGILDYLHKKGL
jgi:acyl carrier protein